MIRDGRRLHRHTRAMPGAVRHFISPIISAGAEFLGAAPDIAQTVGQIAAPALTGAGIGALTGALTGGKAGTGALIGGGLGALGGATGATGALANYLGLTGAGNSLADTLGISQTMSPSDLLDANGNSIVPPVPPDAAASGAIQNAGAASGAAGPAVAQAAADASGGGGGLFGGKGISGTAASLGVLAALASALSKPKVGGYNITPNSYSGLPSAANNPNVGPTFNAPLNTSVPGRQPLSPQVPNWYTYGQLPEQQFFAGNSLSNFGFAEGGALDHQFSTENGERHVRGPGTGTSDDVDARLSNGEYVLTAADVARVGDGSNDRGARILDHDRGALAKLLGEKKFTREKLKKPEQQDGLR